MTYVKKVDQKLRRLKLENQYYDVFKKRINFLMKECELFTTCIIKRFVSPRFLFHDV